MGTCSSSRVDENNTNPNNLIITEDDIVTIRNSWKLVVAGGLSKYGINMMTR